MAPSARRSSAPTWHGGHAALSLSLGAALTLLLAACSTEGEPRAQLLVVVDTNVPVVEQLSDPTLSPAAAIDTLRVEMLDRQGQVTEERTLLVPAVADWPVSFGSVADTGNIVRLRLRAYRGVFAAPGSTSEDAEPLPEITVDRLVRLEHPDEGVQAAHVMLDGACLGTPSTLGESWLTCIGAESLAASPSEGVRYDEGAERASAVGSWPTAREVPCQGEGPGICIPGGFTVLGDTSLAEVKAPVVIAPVPLRPVQLSPFRMDETEFTIQRYQDLLAASKIHEEPFPYDPGSVVQNECTWEHPDSRPELPVNCIRIEAAQAACEADGGSLPTEAQWEHAARGRGRGWRSPWGNEQASCCTASVGQGAAACPDADIAPVGTHRPSDACPVGDESLDGIVDLAGNLGELVLDAWLPYDAPCWTFAGIPVDPVCLDPESEVGSRGGTYYLGLGFVLAALRIKAFVGATGHGIADEQVGFRCVYGGAR